MLSKIKGWSYRIGWEVIYIIPTAKAMWSERKYYIDWLSSYEGSALKQGWALFDYYHFSPLNNAYLKLQRTEDMFIFFCSCYLEVEIYPSSDVNILSYAYPSGLASTGQVW